MRAKRTGWKWVHGVQEDAKGYQRAPALKSRSGSVYRMELRRIWICGGGFVNRALLTQEGRISLEVASGGDGVTLGILNYVIV